MIKTAIGIMISFFLLSFVKQWSFFDVECFYIGDFSNKICFRPGTPIGVLLQFEYYGAWALAWILIVWGALSYIKSLKPS